MLKSVKVFKEDRELRSAYSTRETLYHLTLIPQFSNAHLAIKESTTSTTSAYLALSASLSTVLSAGKIWAPGFKTGKLLNSSLCEINLYAPFHDPVPLVVRYEMKATLLHVKSTRLHVPCLRKSSRVLPISSHI